MISGDEVRRAREELGESQAAFASRLGVDQSVVSRWEKKGVPQRGTALIAVQKILAEIAATNSEAA